MLAARTARPTENIIASKSLWVGHALPSSAKSVRQNYQCVASTDQRKYRARLVRYRAQDEEDAGRQCRGRPGGIHGNREEDEDILSVVLPAKAFIERVRSGEINDLKTLVAGYWFAEREAAGKFS